jgi:pimeloyl-ACP methyl ester carboxylesterase
MKQHIHLLEAVGEHTRLEDVPDQYLMIDDLELRYRRLGPHGGVPLLLVNGIGAALEMWAPFVEQLIDVDLVIVDLPGSGRSQPPRFPVTMAWFATSVVRVLDDLGLDRVDVLGFSFGGAVVQQLAHDHPQRVRRLVLCATTPGIPAVPGSPFALLAAASPLRYLDEQAGMFIVPWMAGGRTLREPDLMTREVVRRQLEPPTWWGYLMQVTAITWWSAHLWLGALRMPTLVLHGDRDPLCPVVNARWLAGRIAGSTMVVLPGAGHLFLLDEPQRAAEIVRDFLR